MPRVPTRRPAALVRRKRRHNTTVSMTATAGTVPTASAPHVESLAERLAYVSIIIGMVATLSRSIVSPAATFHLPRLTAMAITLLTLCSRDADPTSPDLLINLTTLHIFAYSEYATAVMLGVFAPTACVGFYYLWDRYGYLRMGHVDRWPGVSLSVVMYFYQPVCFSSVRILWLHSNLVDGAHLLGWMGIGLSASFFIGLYSTRGYGYHATWSHMHGCRVPSSNQAPVRASFRTLLVLWGAPASLDIRMKHRRPSTAIVGGGNGPCDCQHKCSFLNSDLN